MSMSYIAVAVDAGKHPARFSFGKHLVHDIGMAVHAGVLSHSPVSWLNLYWLLKVFKRKGQ
jgi:hypothetical protein